MKISSYPALADHVRLVFEAGYAMWVEAEDGLHPIKKTEVDPQDILGHRLLIQTDSGSFVISRHDPRINWRGDGAIWSSEAWRRDPLWYLSQIYAEKV